MDCILLCNVVDLEGQAVNHVDFILTDAFTKRPAEGTLLKLWPQVYLLKLFYVVLTTCQGWRKIWPQSLKAYLYCKT